MAKEITMSGRLVFDDGKTSVTFDKGVIKVDSTGKRVIQNVQTIGVARTYNTGTITVADGEVTGSGTTFPAWAASGYLTVGGNNFSVETRGSNTVLQLDNTLVDFSAGATYTLTEEFELLSLGESTGALTPGVAMFYNRDLTNTVTISGVNSGGGFLKLKPQEFAGPMRIASTSSVYAVAQVAAVELEYIIIED